MENMLEAVTSKIAPSKELVDDFNTILINSQATLERLHAKLHVVLLSEPVEEVKNPGPQHKEQSPLMYELTAVQDQMKQFNRALNALIDRIDL